MVLAFAEAGADVVIASRKLASCEATAEEVRKATGRRALPVACHVGHWGQVEALAERAYAEFGRVDVLVNNAGGNTGFDRGPVADGDLADLAADWRANLDANLLSAVLVTAALTPRFAPDARIISFSSIAARRGAGSYGAAKAAVEAWTADVARELGPRGITANVVSPGLTLGSEFFRDTLTEARKQRLIAETDNGRPGTTADVAALVAFLASPSAGHLTGQVIHVNGGAYLGR
jgi:3-oxoacyl-[acyl-carrier protein] reductase